MAAHCDSRSASCAECVPHRTFLTPFSGLFSPTGCEINRHGGELKQVSCRESYSMESVECLLIPAHSGSVRSEAVLTEKRREFVGKGGPGDFVVCITLCFLRAIRTPDNPNGSRRYSHRATPRGGESRHRSRETPTHSRWIVES